MRNTVLIASALLVACSSDPGSAGPVLVPDADTNVSFDAHEPQPDTGLDAEIQTDTSAGSPNASGTRLELRYQVTRASDGTVVRASEPSYYDRQLETQCLFLQAKDGKQRCVPLLGGSVSGVFADAACNEALVYRSACDIAPRFYSTLAAAQCSTTAWTVFEVGAKHSGQIYSKSGDTCTPQPARDTLAYYRLGRELQPDEFVSAEITTEP
ncbi:MAG: hypothetical protein JNJ59_14960 [Deltaproteobacteria bacterium]|nr:hypothetical protein [Deltaproteobacteria bacterium]